MRYLSYSILTFFLASAATSFAQEDTLEYIEPTKEEILEHGTTNKEMNEGTVDQEEEELGIEHNSPKKEIPETEEEKIKNVEFSKKNFPDDKQRFKAAYKEYKDGKYYYDMGNSSAYKVAFKHLRKAYEFNPDNAELCYMLGKCCINVVDKKEAYFYFDRAYKIDKNINDDLILMLGESHHVSEDFSKAIEWYEKYKEDVLKSAEGDTAKVQKKIDAVEKKISECAFGIYYTSNPENVQIENIGGVINSRFAEYGVLITADESTLMFTSQRPQGTTAEMAAREIYFEDIYMSKKQENGKWSTPLPLGDSINDPLRHDATMALSPDGQQLLIYRDDLGDGNIYMSELIGNDWTKPKKMPNSISSTAHESSASFSSDGNTIYFVSDRCKDNVAEKGDNGKCTHDIYYSNWDEEKGMWGKAENIGDILNTKHNEQGVFMHPDGKTLYFSSQGHSSMGGFDIFYSSKEDGEWTKPVNMGYPVNHGGNDLMMVLSSNGDRGYYSSFSSKAGFGDEDIYVITFKEHQVEHLTILKGKIMDAITLKPLEAEIVIIDNDSNKVIHRFHSNSATGDYLVSLPSGRNYGIEIDEENHVFHSENFNIPEATGYQEIEKDIYLKNIAVGSSIVLKNVFFEHASAELKPASITELERLVKFLNDVPNVRIEISGHTDSVGKDAYNLDLSDRRAKSVVEYLIGRGIDAARLEAKGYGETAPIADNKTEEGKALNRRTEFKIIE